MVSEKQKLTHEAASSPNDDVNEQITGHHVFITPVQTYGQWRFTTPTMLKPDQGQLEGIIFGCSIPLLLLLIEFRNCYGSRLDSCILIDYHINTNFPLLTRSIIQWIPSLNPSLESSTIKYVSFLAKKTILHSSQSLPFILFQRFVGRPL